MAEHVYVCYFNKLIFLQAFQFVTNPATNLKPCNTGEKKVLHRLQKGDDRSRWRMTYSKGHILTKK